MSLFTEIFSKFHPDIDIQRCAFEHPNDRNSPINDDFITYSFINSLNANNELHSNFKYLCLKNIISNTFIHKDKADQILNTFSKTQSVIFGFNKLARIFKLNHARHSTVEHDLYMNPLSSFKPSVLIDLFDDDTRTIYKFRISDIIHFSNTALSNSPEFFADPLPIKNPYTNVPFTFAQLYTIYFHIHKSPFQMPMLLRLYYQSSFCLDTFLINNEAYIRDIAIKNFLFSGSDNLKHYYISKLIIDNKDILNHLYIHPNFPTDKLIIAFSPFLKDYLTVCYSLNPTAKFKAKLALKKKLTNFYKYNPKFGKRIIYSNNSLTDPSGMDIEYSFIDTINYRSQNNTPRTRRVSSDLSSFNEPHPSSTIDNLQNAMSDIINISVNNTDNTISRLNNLRQRLLDIPNDTNTIISGSSYSSSALPENSSNTLPDNSSNTLPDNSSNTLPDNSLNEYTSIQTIFPRNRASPMTEELRESLRTRLENSESPTIRAIMSRYTRSNNRTTRVNEPSPELELDEEQEPDPQEPEPQEPESQEPEPQEPEPQEQEPSSQNPDFNNVQQSNNTDDDVNNPDNFDEVDV